MSVATPIPFEAAGLNLHQSVEFIQALFQPDDTICVVAIKNVTAQVRQNFLLAMDYPATVGKMCAGNDNGWSYYICMNPLILDAKNRTKENVAEIRHAYIEVDDNGTACLNKIKAELPTPAFILRSSRKGDFDAAKQKMNSDDKYQFIWKVTGFTKEAQERLLARLIELFGGDPQCKDCVRILRLPGFKNTKYKERPVVDIISSDSTREYTSADFPAVPDVVVAKPSFEVPGQIPEGQRNDTLFKLASSLRAKGMDETEIMAACVIANQRCPKPLKPEELKAIVRSALRYDRGPKIEVVSEADVKMAVQTGVVDMPEAVLDGRLGEICQQRMLANKHFPIAYAWPALVTVAAALTPFGNINGECSPDSGQTNLYTALVGGVHTGKSQAGDYARGLLALPEMQTLLHHRAAWTELYAGSAERLFPLLGQDHVGEITLLYMDELKYLLDKANIQGASYSVYLTTLFYRPYATIALAKGSEVKVNTALSILGGIPEDMFDVCFAENALGGLYDRFLIGQYPTDFGEHDYIPWTGQKPEHVKFKSVRLDNSVWESLKALKKEMPGVGRAIEIAYRVKMVCASADGQDVLYGKDMDNLFSPTRALAVYLADVRDRLKPNAGLTIDASHSNAVLAYLERAGGEWVDRKHLKDGTNYARVGAVTHERVINALVRLDEIEQMSVKPLNGGRTKMIYRRAMH